MGGQISFDCPGSTMINSQPAAKTRDANSSAPCVPIGRVGEVIKFHFTGVEEFATVRELIIEYDKIPYLTDPHP